MSKTIGSEPLCQISEMSFSLNVACLQYPSLTKRAEARKSLLQKGLSRYNV